MASFIRSLLQVLLGVVIGFAAATYLLPEARKGGATAPAVGQGPVARPPAAPASTTASPSSPAVATANADDTLFGRRGGAPAPVAATPAKPAPVAEVQPAPTPEPRVETPEPPPPPPVVAEEPVDFRELCIKPAAWPPIITLNKDINAQVMQGEEVIAEIPLSAGEKLQVSKVFGDATAEVRAKGAKFIVNAADTDLAAQARVRLAEISGKPRAPAPVAPVERVTEPPAKAPAPAPTPTQPARGDDLDAKMRSLFGTPQKR